MVIKGVHAVKPVKVDLTKYFDEPHSVTVRSLPALARAQITEIVSDGISYATKQTKAKLDIESMAQAMPAEATMEIRRIKLTSGVVEHDITDDKGALIPWGPPLWDELDAADPDILETVLEVITELYAGAEEGEDPTSPAKSGKK